MMLENSEIPQTVSDKLSSFWLHQQCLKNENTQLEGQHCTPE